MIIPKQIKFLGHIVKVTEVKEIDKKDTDGEYNLYEYTILLKKDNPQTVKESVLFHEIAEMLTAYLCMNFEEVNGHKGFSRYMDLFWAILKENDLIK